MSQNVKVSIGSAELTRPATITDKLGNDITAAPISLSLGDINTPGATWYPPDQDSSPNQSQRTVQLLIDNRFPLGSYYLWLRIETQGQTVQRRVTRVTIS